MSLTHVTSISTSYPSSTASVGDTISFTVQLTDPLMLIGSGFMLHFSNGASCNSGFAGIPGMDTLQFDYTVGAGQDTADLTISSMDVNGLAVGQFGTSNVSLVGVDGADTHIAIGAAAPTVTVPPDAPIILSAGGPTNQSVQSVTGTAPIGTTVSVYNGANLLGTVLAGPLGDWSLPVVLSNGQNEITATAYDGSNTSAASSTLTYTLDMTPPNPPSIDPLPAATNQTVTAVTGTGEIGSTVELFDGATSLGSVIVGPLGTWSIPVSLGVGSHSLTAMDTDPAGNSSVSAVANVTVDITSPNPPSIDALPAATNQPVAAVAGTGEIGSTVELFDGATSIGSVVVGALGTWSLPVSLGVGSHSLTAVATDPAGNASDPSTVANCTVDLTAPDAPSIDALPAATNQPVTAATGTGEIGSTVELFDGATSIGSVVVGALGTWSLPVSLGVGSHSLTAVATDPAGNASDPSTVANCTVDLTAPDAPSIDALPLLTNRAVSAVTGTGEIGSTVQLFDGETPVGTAVVGPNGHWTIDAAALGNGSHSLTAVATDPAGNVGEASAPVAYGVVAPIDPVTGQVLPEIDPQQSGLFAITNVNLGLSGTSMGETYGGPVTSLEHQLIWNGTQSIALTALTGNAFLHGGSGDDALQATSGSNVLDGGAGSNFLVGALANSGGNDTFFVDARTSAPTWSTIVNFHVGDQAAIWGFQDETSQANWVGQAGVTGFTGATLSAQVNGHESSLTFAGLSDDQGSGLSFSTGTVGDQNYLLITRTS